MYQDKIVKKRSFLDPFKKQEVLPPTDAMPEQDQNESKPRPKMSGLDLFLTSALGALSGSQTGIGPLAGAAGAFGGIQKGIATKEKGYAEEDVKNQANLFKAQESILKNAREEKKSNELKKYRDALLSLKRNNIGDKQEPDDLKPFFDRLDDADKKALLEASTNDLILSMSSDDPGGRAAAEYIYKKKVKDKRFLQPIDEAFLEDENG